MKDQGSLIAGLDLDKAHARWDIVPQIASAFAASFFPCCRTACHNGRHQPHPMSQLAELSFPIAGGRARLHLDQAGCLLSEERQQLAARPTTLQIYSHSSVNAAPLENGLPKVQTDYHHCFSWPSCILPTLKAGGLAESRPASIDGVIGLAARG